MYLFAGGVSPENRITVIALCITVIVLVLFDAALLVSLQRRNKKLANKRRIEAETDNEEKNG